MNRTPVYLLGALLAGVLLVVGGVMLFSASPSAPASVSTTDASSTEPRPFIESSNPIVSTDSARLVGDRVSLEKALREYGAAEESNGDLTKFGIYFRDFASGASIGIHESIDFSPASLLKLPLAMWYYKKAETNPDLLSDEIKFVGPKGTSIEQFPAQQSIQVGQVYTIEQLIEYMLAQSDNDATAILSQYSNGAEKVNAVYTSLGIPDVQNYATYIIDVHTYATFFQVLYKAQYLDRDFSNKLLGVMTHSSFTDGLVAGVPASVQVAHKFGERTIDASKKLFQLHDCGIVYATTPYLLCVMTQASSYEKATNFISTVSRMTYQAFGAAPAEGSK